MREIDVAQLIPFVRDMCIRANRIIPPDVQEKLQSARDAETNPLAIDILDACLQNNRLAGSERMPICQDTGVALLFIELGQDVHLTRGDFYEALQEGVRQGYREGLLRLSMVDDPVIDRKNTGDNTPALIYTDIVPGDRLRITFAPKGGGAENMSALRMLTPADGLSGVRDFVVDTIRRAGGNPCPPVIVGVGLGGDFEQCALLAKKALLRPLNEPNPVPKWRAVEADLLERINKLGIGPQGLGGATTALAVHILAKPCHIASLPVAVNLQCHAARHATLEV
jgi:fumarate hydratase subunit alpha